MPQIIYYIQKFRVVKDNQHRSAVKIIFSCLLLLQPNKRTRSLIQLTHLIFLVDYSIVLSGNKQAEEKVNRALNRLACKIDTQKDFSLHPLLTTAPSGGVSFPELQLDPEPSAERCLWEPTGYSMAPRREREPFRACFGNKSSHQPLWSARS